MYETAYDIVTQGMRYFFIALIFYILLRVVLQSLREYRSMQEIKQKVRSVSPGYLEVLAPLELAGEKFPLKRENTVGRSKRADICIDHRTLAPIHAFIYEKKDGLYIANYGSNNVVLLNGERICKNEELLYTADTIGMGAVIFRLHLSGEELFEEEDSEENEKEGKANA